MFVCLSVCLSITGYLGAYEWLILMCVYFASMAYRGLCTAYELRMDYAHCAPVALPLRRCCFVEYFAALH